MRAISVSPIEFCRAGGPLGGRGGKEAIGRDGINKDVGDAAVLRRLAGAVGGARMLDGPAGV